MNLKVVLLIVTYFLVGCIWLWVTPPFESSDEYKHYPVIQYIQNEHQLVVLDPENPGRWQQEGAQPPLYYLLMAAISAPIDSSDFDSIYQRNPHAFIGDPNQIRNKNIMLHNPASETFPSSGAIAAVYLIRITSLLIGCATVWFSYRIARLFTRETVALFAAALTAFNPMFLFTSAAVNNDSLANFFGAAGLYFVIRLWQHYQKPASKQRPYFLIVVLGIVLGLGMLTKLSLGGLLLLTGISVAWLAWRKSRWQILFVDGLSIFLIAMTILTPWLIHNINSYGFADITGINTFIEVQGTRATSMTWQDWWGEFGTFYRSFWGLFGGVNVAAPQWWYGVLNGLVVLSLIGWLRFPDKRSLFGAQGGWLTLGWIAILLVLLLRWTIISPAFQGRLIFPALPAINLLLALGLTGLFKRRSQQQALMAAASAFFALSAFILPISTIRPAYAYPDSLSQVPESAKISPIRFRDQDTLIELVGVELEPMQSRVAGDAQPIRIVLYWLSAETMSTNYLTSINILGRDLAVVGRVDRYPGWGMWPTSRWQADEIYRDEYAIYLAPDAVAPSRLQIKVDVWDSDSGQHLLPIDEADNQLSLVIVGEARLYEQGPQLPAVDHKVAAQFDEGITFYGFDLADELTTDSDIPITLVWQADQTVTVDYTVFVQLLDERGNLVGSGDGRPVDNQFYPTTFWRAGDVIVDDKLIKLNSAELEPGTYMIAVGLYDASSQRRLLLLDGLDAIRWQIELTKP